MAFFRLFTVQIPVNPFPQSRNPLKVLYHDLKWPWRTKRYHMPRITAGVRCLPYCRWDYPRITFFPHGRHPYEVVWKNRFDEVLFMVDCFLDTENRSMQTGKHFITFEFTNWKHLHAPVTAKLLIVSVIGCTSSVVIIGVGMSLPWL